MGKARRYARSLGRLYPLRFNSSSFFFFVLFSESQRISHLRRRFSNVARIVIDRNGNCNGGTEEFSLVYLRYKNSSGKRPQQSPRKHLEVHLAGVPVHKHVPPRYNGVDVNASTRVDKAVSLENPV